MENRIKDLRLALNMTQEEFGKRIGVKKASISTMESGKSNPSDQTLVSIIREYGVNEEWLREGTGEPFRQDDESVVTRLVKEYNLDELDRAIIDGYLQLGPLQRAVIKQYITGLVGTFAAEGVESYTMPAQGNSAAKGILSAADRKALGEIKNDLLKEDDSKKLL